MIDPSILERPAPPPDLRAQLLQLEALSRCGFSIEVNRHRQGYETAAQELANLEACVGPLAVDPSIRAQMIELDSIVAIQCYARTPIGFELTLHFALEAAVAAALESITRE